MTAVSLCSGYGGLDLACEAVYGLETAYVAEVDPHASQVLAARFPHAVNLGDLKTIEWSTLGDVDLITAGYPCQPFSQAGRRQGEEDPRHLWPWIADAVRHLRPRRVVLENVPGHRSKGFGTVLGDLAACGYDARWVSVRASDVGAPHRRDRVFIVAHPDGVDVDRGRGERKRWRSESSDRHLPSPDTVCERAGRDARGLPLEVGEGRRSDVDLRAARDAGSVAVADSHLARLEGPEPAERLDLPAWGDYGPAIERWEHVTRAAPVPAIEGRLNPRFVEWMMGLPDGWVTDVVTTRTHALRILGNGVVPQQAAHALRYLG